ncbi:MAG: hypothetical protein U1E30_07290 [Rhodoblastus sp.]
MQNALLERTDRRIVAEQRVDEGAGLVQRERRDFKRPSARHATQRLAFVGRTGGKNERDPQAPGGLRHRRQRLKRFLVAPMDIIDSHYQWRFGALRPADGCEGVRDAPLARVRVQAAPGLVHRLPQQRSQRLRMCVEPQPGGRDGFIHPPLDLNGRLAFAYAKPSSKQLTHDRVRRAPRGRFAIGYPDGRAFAG